MISCVSQVKAGEKKLNLRAEAGLVSCVKLLIHVVPYISDTTLMDILQVKSIIE